MKFIMHRFFMLASLFSFLSANELPSYKIMDLDLETDRSEAIVANKNYIKTISIVNSAPYYSITLKHPSLNLRKDLTEEQLETLFKFVNSENKYWNQEPSKLRPNHVNLQGEKIIAWGEALDAFNRTDNIQLLTAIYEAFLGHTTICPTFTRLPSQDEVELILRSLPNVQQLKEEGLSMKNIRANKLGPNFVLLQEIENGKENVFFELGNEFGVNEPFVVKKDLEKFTDFPHDQSIDEIFNTSSWSDLHRFAWIGQTVHSTMCPGPFAKRIAEIYFDVVDSFIYDGIEVKMEGGPVQFRVPFTEL